MRRESYEDIDIIAALAEGLANRSDAFDRKAELDRLERIQTILNRVLDRELPITSTRRL